MFSKAFDKSANPFRPYKAELNAADFGMVLAILMKEFAKASQAAQSDNKQVADAGRLISEALNRLIDNAFQTVMEGRDDNGNAPSMVSDTFDHNEVFKRMSEVMRNNDDSGDVHKQFVEWYHEQLQEMSESSSDAAREATNIIDFVKQHRD